MTPPTDYEEPFEPEHALVPLTAHGLAGSMVDLPSGPFGPSEWFGLVAQCRAHGLVAMLAAAAQRGDMSLSQAQAEELAVLENEAAGLALLVEQRVVQLSGLLTAAGISHRLLGGPARARLGYRQPGVRVFDSATVLVGDPGALGVTVAPRGVLMDTAVRYRDDQVIGLAQLSDPATLLALAEHPVPTVSLEEHLVLACLEASVNPSLVVQRDIAELALFPAIDPERVQHTAENWGVVAGVANAVVEVWKLFALADRTRLSVWAGRVSGVPMRSSPAPAPAPRPELEPPRRRSRSRMGRVVHKIAGGGGRSPGSGRRIR